MNVGTTKGNILCIGSDTQDNEKHLCLFHKEEMIMKILNLLIFIPLIAICSCMKLIDWHIGNNENEFNLIWNDLKIGDPLEAWLKKYSLRALAKVPIIYPKDPYKVLLKFPDDGMKSYNHYQQKYKNIVDFKKLSSEDWRNLVFEWSKQKYAIIPRSKISSYALWEADNATYDNLPLDGSCTMVFLKQVIYNDTPTPYLTYYCRIIIDENGIVLAKHDSYQSKDNRLKKMQKVGIYIFNLSFPATVFDREEIKNPLPAIILE